MKTVFLLLYLGCIQVNDRYQNFGFFDSDSFREDCRPTYRTFETLKEAQSWLAENPVRDAILAEVGPRTKAYRVYQPKNETFRPLIVQTPLSALFPATDTSSTLMQASSSTITVEASSSTIDGCILSTTSFSSSTFRSR